MSYGKRKIDWQSGVLRGVLFVFLAIPGALITFFAGFLFIAMFILPEERVARRPVIYSFALVVGVLMTLIGLGKVREWLYSFVFLSVPLTIWLYSLVNPTAFGGTMPFLLVVALSAFGTFALIKRHYANRT